MHCRSSYNALFERSGSNAAITETSLLLFIDSRMEITGTMAIEGDIGSVALPLSRIIDRATAARARQILLVHTHPSGDARPSLQDITVTRRLCAQLRGRNMRLMDHIILTTRRYFSFRMNRML